MGNESALVLHSGGQDSTTCLYWALKSFKQVEVISFDYGQRHRVELQCARSLAEELGLRYRCIDLSFLADLSSNALTNSELEPSLQGGLHGLPSTFVPGRNLLFLSVAASYAGPRGIENIVTGVCQTDYSGYPDCRQTFIDAAQSCIEEAIQTPIKLHTPLMFLTKAETFGLAEELGCLENVIERSHTCYRGDRSLRHDWGYGCGQCPACELRERGFDAYQAALRGVEANG